MTVIRFDEWLPDQAAYQNPGVLRAENVYPSAGGYLPVRDLSVVTDALDDRPRGAIQLVDDDLTVYQFAGDESKLYQNVSESWTDRSIGGGYSTGSGEAWEFVAWKNKVLATNFSDNPQQLTLGGTQFSNLTTAFQARHLTTIRDFVVMANTFDSSDGNVPSRIRWSAFNDETDWTVSASTLSDFQDLKNEPIERIFGGEFGVVLQKNTVWRMTFVGAPVVFQFDEVLPGIGLMAPGAAVRDGDFVYFLSDRGFFSLSSGSKATPVGAEKVDRFVLDDVDKDNTARISATVDPNSHKVFWAYPGAGNVSGRPNRIIIYDPSLQRWSLILKEVEFIWAAGGTGQTLETLDNFSASIDDLEVSLDSRQWVGGSPLLAAFDTTFKSGFFNGDKLNALIETGDIEIHSGFRTLLNAFRPVVEGGTATARIGTRDRQTDAMTFGSTLSLSSSGRFVCRENARYHRFRLNLSDDWEHAVGIQIEPREARKAGGR